MPEGQALVLGGGGVAGIAWMTGVLAGLADAGRDVTGADLLVGTSAGAAVAAQVGSGLPLDALFERQVDPALQSREISVELDMEKFGAEFTELLAGMNSAESPQEAQRRIRRGALIHHDLFGDAVAAGYVDAGFTPLPIPSGTARPDVRFVRRIGLWIRRG